MGGVIVMTVGILMRRSVMRGFFVRDGVLPVIVMVVFRRGGGDVVLLVALRGGLSIVVMAVGGGRSVMPLIVMAVGLGGGRGMVIVAVAGILAVIVVRLVLVAHCDSVPQPLSAVFAAKSV